MGMNVTSYVLTYRGNVNNNTTVYYALARTDLYSVLLCACLVIRLELIETNFIASICKY